MDSADRYATGELALWAEGSFIRGYLAVSALDGEAFDDPEFSLVQGELEGGRFRLAFTILRDPFRAKEATLSLGHDPFSFGTTVVSGEWIEQFPDETILKGTYNWLALLELNRPLWFEQFGNQKIPPRSPQPLPPSTDGGNTNSHIPWPTSSGAGTSTERRWTG